MTFQETSPEDVSKADDFQQIYLTYQSFIRRVIFLVSGPEELDDLVQETFFKIWKGRRQFREESQLKTWIYRIAVNTAIDFVRKKKPVYTPHSFDLLPTNRIIDALSIRKALRFALSELPVKMRVCFILYYQLELSLAEISKILNIREGTVKSRLFHAREKVCHILSEAGVIDEAIR